MLRLRSVCRCGVLAVAAGLTMASGPVTTSQDETTRQTPAQQAWAHEPRTEHRTYYDTPEDRMMRELTDDGAHDRSDTQR